MPQLNINMTPEFEKDLKQLMKNRQLKTKAETIKIAIKECLDRTMLKQTRTDFKQWLGRGKEKAENNTRRFKSDDDLW